MKTGNNLSETMKKIQGAISNVRQLKNDRSSINEDIAAVREGLQALGIHKQAFDMALRYLDMDADKRQNFDLAYSLVREAGGLPLQADLFAEAEKLEKAVVEQKKADAPSAKDIAERMFEQTTRQKAESKPSNVTKLPGKKAAPDDEPPSAGGTVAAFAKEVEKMADAES